jgi:hypothetical protein
MARSMTFPEFREQALGFSPGCPCGECADCEHVDRHLRRIYDYLVGTAADPGAVLSGAEPTTRPALVAEHGKLVDKMFTDSFSEAEKARLEHVRILLDQVDVWPNVASPERMRNEVTQAKARIAELERVLVRLRGVCLHWEAVANDLDGKRFAGVRDMLRRCAKGLRGELAGSVQAVADAAKPQSEPDYTVADEDASPFKVDADQDQFNRVALGLGGEGG